MKKNRIGETIGRLRRKAGLTQEELGRAVGVSTQAVSRWECKGAPDVELLPSIADQLHVTVDELFGRTGQSKAELNELLEQAIREAAPEKRIITACQLAWTMQKALVADESPDVAPDSLSDILEAAAGYEQQTKAPDSAGGERPVRPAAGGADEAFSGRGNGHPE